MPEMVIITLRYICHWEDAVTTVAVTMPYRVVRLSPVGRLRQNWCSCETWLESQAVLSPLTQEGFGNSLVSLLIYLQNTVRVGLSAYPLQIGLSVSVV